MKTSAATFELGVTRLFGNGDISSSGLLHGWAEPEDAHSWNDGMEAVMELTVKKSKQRYIVEFEGEPFLKAPCPTQELTLYCNGFWVGFWKLDNPKAYTISATIEPEQMFLRNDGAFARLVWLLPNSTRPLDIRLNDDGRQLGFCFRSLTVKTDASMYS